MEQAVIFGSLFFFGMPKLLIFEVIRERTSLTFGVRYFFSSKINFSGNIELMIFDLTSTAACL